MKMEKYFKEADALGGIASKIGRNVELENPFFYEREDPFPANPFDEEVCYVFAADVYDGCDGQKYGTLRLRVPESVFKKNTFEAVYNYVKRLDKLPVKWLSCRYRHKDKEVLKKYYKKIKTNVLQ